MSLSDFDPTNPNAAYRNTIRGAIGGAAVGSAIPVVGTLGGAVAGGAAGYALDNQHPAGQGSTYVYPSSSATASPTSVNTTSFTQPGSGQTSGYTTGNPGGGLSSQQTLITGSSPATNQMPRMLSYTPDGGMTIPYSAGERQDMLNAQVYNSNHGYSPTFGGGYGGYNPGQRPSGLQTVKGSPNIGYTYSGNDVQSTINALNGPVNLTPSNDVGKQVNQMYQALMGTGGM